MSGVLKTVGKVASTIAPFASKIPGLGTIAGGLLGAGGSLLQGQGIGQALGAGFSSLNPFGGVLNSLSKGFMPNGGGGGAPPGMVDIGGFMVPSGDPTGGGAMGVANSIGDSTNSFLSTILGGVGSGGSFNLPDFITQMGNPTFNSGQSGGYGQQGHFSFTPQAQGGPTQSATAAPSMGIADKIFGFLKDPKNLALLGMGGAGVAGILKSGATAPQVVNDPRNNTDNTFNTMLQNALKTGDIGQILSSGKLPQYTGPYAADPNAAQTGAMGGLQDIIQQISGSGQGQSILGTLQGMSQAGGQLQLPPELQALLGAGSQGNGILQGIGQGTDPTAQLLRQLGVSDPTQGGQQLIGQGAGLLQSLASSPQILQLLSGGQGADINQIGQMLTNASAPGLSDNIQNLREQFSFNGLRNSTDLNQGVSNLMARNQAGIQGALASIIPQITQGANQTSLGTGNLLQQIAGSIGNLGGAAGNLGIGATGQQSSALQALLSGQAGAGTALNQGGNQQLSILSQLFGQQQGNALGAATALPSAYTGIMSLLPQLLQQQFSQGTTLQNNAQTGVNNQMAQFNTGNSLIPMLLQYLQSTPQQQVGPSVLSQLGGLVTQGAVAKQLK